MKLYNKGIGAVVATALLIVVTVAAVIGYQTWFGTYSSEIYSQSENSDMNIINTEYLDSDKIYVKNSNDLSVNYLNILIDSKSCNISGTINSGIQEIQLKNCTNGMEIGPKEVTIITNEGVFSKYLMLKEVTLSSSNGILGFSGYAYGENFGYISFKGNNYQVLYNNITGELSGYAYSENFGYISFSGTNYQVTNVNGVLTGNAYGENIGYINFNSTSYQTTFNGTNLDGNAYSENFGYINFNNPSQYEITYIS